LVILAFVVRQVAHCASLLGKRGSEHVLIDSSLLCLCCIWVVDYIRAHIS
jgi:hypothetical protein